MREDNRGAVRSRRRCRRKSEEVEHQCIGISIEVSIFSRERELLCCCVYGSFFKGCTFEGREEGF